MSGKRRGKRQGWERRIERETGPGVGERYRGEREREIQGRKRGRDRGEREGETGEKERVRERERGKKKLQTQKIHGILSCRASIRLPRVTSPITQIITSNICHRSNHHE